MEVLLKDDWSRRVGSLVHRRDRPRGFAQAGFDINELANVVIHGTIKGVKRGLGIRHIAEELLDKPVHFELSHDNMVSIRTLTH